MRIRGQVAGFVVLAAAGTLAAAAAPPIPGAVKELR
jgi:hypothetical protein